MSSSVLYNERVKTCREMRGEGVGRGHESDDQSLSLEALLNERKAFLNACCARWKAFLTEEQKNSLLNLREEWTTARIRNEHVLQISNTQMKYMEFQRYRIQKGELNENFQGKESE